MTPGNSALSFARGNQRYHYDWETETNWAGTGREHVLWFADGTERTALFSFR